MYVITRYAHAKNNLKMILGCELGDNFFKKTCSLINPYNKQKKYYLLYIILLGRGKLVRRYVSYIYLGKYKAIL